MFQVILVAVDGSRHAERALELAARLAARDEARLVVVHVQGHGAVPESLRHMAEVEHLVEPDVLTGAGIASMSRGVPLTREGKSAAHREQVHRALAAHITEGAVTAARRHGVAQVEGVTEDGPPAQCIVERARAESADLVVMGTRGLSDLTGLLMGSVSHQVCQLAECPCLTVK